MGKTNAQRIGVLGEDIAAQYLQAQGYRVHARNARSRAGEIDIIARSPQGALCFTEVKSVEISSFDQALSYDPLDKLSPRKIQRLSRTIEHYLQEHGITDSWQLDAVVVYINTQSREARCRLYQHISRD